MKGRPPIPAAQSISPERRTGVSPPGTESSHPAGRGDKRENPFI